MTISPIPNNASVPRVVSWNEFLNVNIDFSDWRTDEFDSDTLTLVPDVTNPRTLVKNCDRTGCWVRIAQNSKICASCVTEFKNAKSQKELLYEQFVLSVRPERARLRPGPCAVCNCPRTASSKGLCPSHGSAYRQYVVNKDQNASVENWVRARKVTPALQPLPRCAVERCPFDSKKKSPLCVTHSERYQKSSRNWKGLTIDIWLDTIVEPYVDATTGSPYASLAATPFALLREPLRWELLYALQQRDLEGRSGLNAIYLRILYLKLRAASVESLVGQEACGWDAKMHANMRGFLKSIQWHIDEGHRQWLGPESQDPRLVLFRDLDLRTNRHTQYKTRALDLRKFSHEWVSDSLLGWVRATSRSPGEISIVERAWKIADAAIPQGRHDPRDLTISDMDLAIRAILRHSDNPQYQKKLILGIKKVLEHVRADERLRH